MKIKTIFSAVAFGMIASAAHAAALDMNSLCALIQELKGVFNVLRILAFVGAAFVLASIGWEAIIKKEYKWAETGKQHLTAMIIGFALLFSVGVILQFLTSGRAGCAGGVW